MPFFLAFLVITTGSSSSAALLRYPATQPCEHAPLNGTAACNVSVPLEQRLDALLAQLRAVATDKQRAGLLQNIAPQIGALSLAPYHWWNEALHGVAGDGAASAGLSIGACFKSGLLQPKKCATSFPAAITSASALNISLTRAIGTAVGTEARVFSNLGHTGLTFWTPNVNVRWFTLVPRYRA